MRAEAGSGIPLKPCSGKHPVFLLPYFIGRRNSQGQTQGGGERLF